jgi:Rieske Fe-S protein
MQRRDFLKNTCSICLLGGAGIAALQLNACSPKVGSALARPDVKNNKITIPTALFNTNPVQIITPNKYPYEIAVQKMQDGTYQALLLKCTHYDNQLMPTGKGYTCQVHGSNFDASGKVTKGPAAEPLLQLKTTILETDLLIQLI